MPLFPCPNCQHKVSTKAATCPYCKRPLDSLELPPDLATDDKPPEAEASGGPSITVAVAAGIDMRFAWVPPGEFLMGSPKGERGRSRSETQRRVHLSKGFYLGIYPVTQAQWTAVMGANPSRFKGDDHPAAGLSWRACLKFCEKLSGNLEKRFRLPTEAEWEYACRAGTTTPFYFGETISPEQANYDGTRAYGKGGKGVNRNKTTPVGMFPPNAWGLYDMHGNVWEWCSAYEPGGDNDVHEPPPSEARIEPARRGGAWCEPPENLRSASRLSGDVAGPGTTGCRLVLC